MKIFEFFAAGRFSDRLVATLCCFPLAVLLIVCLSGFSIAFNHSEGYIVSERFTFFCLFYLSTASVLAVSLRLYGEDRSGLMRHAVTAAVHAVWIAAAVYLAFHYPFDIMTGWGCFALCTAVAVSLCQLSFLRRPDDLRLWNFTLRLVSAAATVGIVGILLGSGISILLLSFEHLFGLSISYRFYIDAWIFCGTLLCPVLFLLLVPSGAEKHDDSALAFTGFGKGVIHYLFIPLLAAYLLTLYVYSAKIIISWELPDGWVTWLVSVSMLGMIAIICIVYPVRFAAGMRFDKWLMRWLPLMVLPLLLLMTVGTVRRVGDYGITVWRLYLIAFNVWCYAVCLVLFFTRSRRIWWIPASLSAVLLVTSVGPQSFANVTRTVLARDIVRELASAGYGRLPLTGKDYRKWIAAEGDGDTNSKIIYLYRHYNGDALKGIIKPGVKLDFGLDGRSGRRGDTAAVHVPDQQYSARCFAAPASVPAGYRRVMPVETWKHVGGSEVKGGYISVTFDSDAGSTEVRIPISRLQEFSETSGNEKGKGSAPLVLASPNALLYVSSYNLSLTGRPPYYFNISGILFLK